MEPVWTALLAMAWRGERLSSTQYIGCGLILLALLALLALLVGRWRAFER